MSNHAKPTSKVIRQELVVPLERHPGYELSMFGGKLTTILRPPMIVDPYVRMILHIEGLGPIVGPLAPNLDVWLTILGARLKNGQLSQQAYDRMLEELRGKQVERMKSDAHGDASGEIAKEIVEANINTFARDSAGCLVMQSYSFRAALRECLSESNYFMNTPGSRERFKNGLGVRPFAIRIERDDMPLTAADSVVSAPELEAAAPRAKAAAEDDVKISDGDKIASQPVHVWAQNKMQHSISQFEVIEPPWRARILVEIRRNLFEGFEGSAAEAEADGESPETKAAASEKDAKEKAKDEKKRERKVRMAPIHPEDIVQACGLLPTICWGAKRSMGYGPCKLIGVSDAMVVKDGDAYPFDWKTIRGL